MDLVSPFWHTWYNVVLYFKFRPWKDARKHTQKHTQIISVFEGWDWEEGDRVLES